MIVMTSLPFPMIFVLFASALSETFVLSFPVLLPFVQLDKEELPENPPNSEAVLPLPSPEPELPPSNDESPPPPPTSATIISAIIANGFVLAPELLFAPESELPDEPVLPEYPSLLPTGPVPSPSPLLWTPLELPVTFFFLPELLFSIAAFPFA